jgi:hypothetical protein
MCAVSAAGPEEAGPEEEEPASDDVELSDAGAELGAELSPCWTNGSFELKSVRDPSWSAFGCGRGSVSGSPLAFAVDFVPAPAVEGGGADEGSASGPLADGVVAVAAGGGAGVAGLAKSAW